MILLGVLNIVLGMAYFIAYRLFGRWWSFAAGLLCTSVGVAILIVGVMGW